MLHHQVDPDDFDKNVDQALPLEQILTPNPQLNDMLSKLKVRKWAFTNAGLVHAERVLGILGIRHHFDGITYCNYRESDIVCKPAIKAYTRAMEQAGVDGSTKCYFVDDSASNVETAATLGWTAVHLSKHPKGDTAGTFHIQHIADLPSVLPELWQ
jgi:pyrimidine and pyridine-specific 5'-nucleotidase